MDGAPAKAKKEEGLVSKVVHEGTLALSHRDALTSNRTRGLAIALARFPAYSTYTRGLQIKDLFLSRITLLP